MTFHDPHMAAGGKAVLLTGPFGEAERTLDLVRPMTIAEVITAHDLAFTFPTIAVMAGEPVLRGVWAVRVVRPGEVLAFVAVPRGGGESGGQGKQIVGLVAALALSIAAPMIGGFVAGAFFGGSTLAASVMSAALLAGGSLLLNAMMPQPTEPAASEADTVYSVTAANNQATPLDVLPVLYGRLRFAPRYAARPYSEFAGNDQYLYQLFAVTAGKAAIERIEIGETEAWSADGGYSASFSDLKFEIIQPGDDIKLFPANVVTASEVSGQSVPDEGDVLGPFTVNAAGTTVDRLAVDFAFPGGLWTADKKGVKSNSIKLRAQYRKIDDDGEPDGSWHTIFAETIKAATRTPQRMSRAIDVPAARYQVQFLADEDFDPDDGNAINKAVWVGLRGYLTGFVTPANCTLLAMKVRANEQLSQLSSSQIRVTALRHLPVWSNGVWETKATRSIAWAAADILRNQDYALGLNEAQYDLAGLATLAGIWQGRGDTFNAMFDRDWTAADALRAVLRAGRTQAVRLAGKIGFVRLQAKAIKRAVFGPRNVVRGSFQHKLVLFDEDKPDSVIGRYIDQDTWQETEVTASLASVGSDAPQTLDWFGITDRAQAWRESVTEAAVNAHQREFVSFTADWEGKLLVRGDPILVQHPFIEGVQSASLRSRVGNVLTIDRDLDAEVEDTPYVILRDKRGEEWGPCRVASIAGRVLTLDAVDAASVASSMGSLAALLPDDRAEPATVLICDGVERPFNGLVVSAVPSASGKVDVLAVIDAPEVYLADEIETEPPPYLPPVKPPTIPTRPQIESLYAVIRTAVAGLELEAMWAPTPGAIYGYVAQVSYDDEDSWTPVYTGMANRFTVPVLPQPLVLRVAAVGQLQGRWIKRVFDPSDIPAGAGLIDLNAIDAEFKKATGILDGEGSLNERLAALRDELEEIAAAASAMGAVGELQRQELLAELDGNKAEYVKQVAVLVNTDQALATEITTLTTDFEDNVAFVGERLQALSTADGAMAELIEEVQVEVDGVSAGGLFKMETEAAPSGWSTKITAKAFAEVAGVKYRAGWFILLNSDGDSLFALEAQRVVFTNTSGSVRLSPFEIDGQKIKLTGVVEIDGDLLVTGTVTTPAMEEDAVTTSVISGQSGMRYAGQNLGTTTIDIEFGSVEVMLTGYQSRPDSGSGNFGFYNVLIKRNGTTIHSAEHFYDDNFTQPIIVVKRDRPGPGEHTYSAEFEITDGNGNFGLTRCQVGAENKKR